MLAIELRFPAGRYHATPWGRHVNEGVAEWPPSPWRLLRALVAVWKRSLPSLPMDVVQPVLQALAFPPEFALPPATVAHSRHYMPWEKKGPTDRTLVLDAFVAVHPSAPTVLRWPDVILRDEQGQILGDLLARLNFLGRAESWCQAQVLSPAETSASGPFNCRAVSDGEGHGATEVVRVLCPDPGSAFTSTRPPAPPARRSGKSAPPAPPLYDPDWQLCIETADVHRERWSQVPGARWVPYRRPIDCFRLDRTPALPLPARRQVTLARYAIDGKLLPQLTDALPLAEALRSALLRKYQFLQHRRKYRRPGRPTEERFRSPILSGKDSQGEPLLTHGHAYFLPTDEDCDGRIDHLTVLATDGFGPGEVEALDSLRRLPFGEGDLFRLLLVGLGVPEDFNAELLRSAARWVSSTPFVVTRHLKKRGRKKDPPALYQRGNSVEFARLVLCEEIDRLRQCRPEIPPPDLIEVLPDNQIGTLRLRPFQFKRFRHKAGDDGGRRATGAFRITFPQPVVGPLVLGHSSHFGLGMFVPDPTQAGG